MISVFLCLIWLGLTSSMPGTSPSIPRACVPPHDKYLFCDATKPVAVRIENLVSMLTNIEKATLLIARESPKGNISRLGIPEYDWGGNCIHGVQSRCGMGTDGKERCPTSYANPNHLGATFNRTIWAQLGNVIGVELRSLWLQNIGENHPPTELPHIGLDCWSPNIGIVRDARWGRNLETTGEDPYLNGQFGKEYTIGLQTSESDPRFLQAIVTLKHFDANSLEGDWPGPGSKKSYPGSGCPGGVCTRHTVDPNISLYDLASTYLPAFRTTVEDGHALGVMCSYNSINGVPSCANPFLLQEQLRQKWGFEGYITSDSGAIADISNTHFYTPDLESACVAAVSSGCDMESAGPYEQYLPGAVAKGTLSQKALDQAVTNTLGLRFRLGLFDPIDDQPMWHVSPDVVRSAAHLQSARESTDQGFVLLQNPVQSDENSQNSHVLPFEVSKSTVVIGPMSTSRQFIVGNYLGQICPGLNSKGQENFDCVQNLAEGIGNETTSAPVVVHGLSSVTSKDEKDFANAVSAAKQAHQVIMFLGNDGSVEGEGHDRHSVALPGAQQALFDQVYAVNKNMVVVLFNGGAIAVDKIKNSEVALVEAWYPGFFGARSIARTIFGHSNRWGKLPITIYSEETANSFDMLDFEMAKAPGRTYRYFTGEPLFPFGYGLSYTKFKLEHQNQHEPHSTLMMTLDSAPKNVSIKATNVGDVAGDEVIMAFFRAETGTIPKNDPASALKKQLFDFERVTLNPGESTVVTFRINPKTLQVFDHSGNGVLYAGNYTLEFTNGVDETVPVSVSTTLEGGAKMKTLDYLHP